MADTQTIKTKGKASQDFVPIKEIRDGIVVLKDSTLHMVLMTSSLNFALKSSDEQDAIIAQYQNFLNSLDFSVQFFIQSRKLNIEPYLDTLREAEKMHTNELLKIQIREYVEFVKTFVETANIVTKTFYVAVSFTPPVLETTGRGIMGNVSSALGLGSKKEDTNIEGEKFEEYKTQLWQRVDTVISGLSRTGVRVVPLNTEELVELYYGLFNPGEVDKGHVPGAAASQQQ